MYGNNSYDVTFDFGLDYFVSESIQIGFKPSFSYQNEEDSILRIFSAFVGPTFNFPISSGVVNSFFVNPNFGVLSTYVDVRDSGSGTETQYGFDLLFGKRFKITDTFAYKPYFDFLFLFSPNTFGFAVMPISFSAIF